MSWTIIAERDQRTKDFTYLLQAHITRSIEIMRSEIWL
jgi:hypothetical protein